MRGAITVEENTVDAIKRAVPELLDKIQSENQLGVNSIISAFFTLTTDLDAGFPAAAARQLQGWEAVPMLCASEVSVPGGLPMCIRVMIHCSMSKKEVKHVYLRGARSLRPDL
ncbi:MAG: chorismate mutase [Clostridiales bacterium]|nr:chorismate mutase [Clostridiales bacterium]MCF8021253.1 chorismate mutase [Clostridiales bacterium]